MKWKVFFLASVVCLGGIGLLWCWGNNAVVSGIAMSIIAAYVFYFPIEFIPSFLREWEKLPAQVLAYRRLQLLLVRLDDIFIAVYKATKGDSTPSPEKNMTLEQFYDPASMKAYMDGFDMSQESKVQSPQGPLSYCQYGCSNWAKVSELAQSLLQMPIVQEDIDFMYEVSYLITDNNLQTIFSLATWLDISKFDCASYLGVNQIGNSSQIKTFNNILNLHRIANAYYCRLKKYKKFNGVVYEPYFYKAKSI